MHPRLIGIGLLPLALAACMSAHPPLGMPDASVIGFDGHRAVAPNCDALNQPSHLVDAGSGRPGMAFGCATYTNLAAMLARPADLVQPLPYAGGDASMASSAVRRFEENRLKQPDVTTTTEIFKLVVASTNKFQAAFLSWLGGCRATPWWSMRSGFR